jgi:perosamine synthetase
MNPIVLMHPYVPSEAISAVSEVLRGRWIGQGPKVEEFEQCFSGRMGGRAAVAVGSGTDALHLAYVLAGIKPGDEVLAPLFTCTATNLPLLWMGAKIRFVDVAPNSLNVDMAHLASLATPKTKAMVIVHYAGSPVHNYVQMGHYRTGVLIEDAAQALGAEWLGKADYSTFSFQAVKHITCGDGGMLLVPQDKVGEARRRRWFGIDREAKLAGIWENDIKEVGWKYQMTDIAAAMGLAGMQKLTEQMICRRHMLGIYREKLAGVPGIELIDADPEGAAWLATVLADNRDGLKRKLAEHKIESDQVHYRNDRYSIFAASRGEFPNMDAVDSKYLCLPLHMHMNSGDTHRVCDVIRSGW